MSKNSKLWLASLLLIFSLVAGVLGAYFYRYQVYAPIDVNSSERVDLVVEKGEKGAHIAQQLYDRGLIRSPLFFRLYLRFVNEGNNLIQAGQYQLSPSMNLAEIVSRLGHGTFDLKLTFIEGWRKEEYAFYLSQVLGPEFAAAFLADTQAKEGYLFPDTYLVGEDITATTLVSLLRSNFDKKVGPELQKGFGGQGLTLDQAVILASIVEREARHEKDRPLIAGVLIKRLTNNWPLEADATTQFAIANEKLKIKNAKLEEIDWWKKELTETDLQVDSPYNTRKNTGLPPTPIANPGLSSLQAVADPQESEYWYYLSDQAGNTYYSKTLEEHNEKIGMYLRE